METKDFVLLMLIPIILVGIVIYTDKGATTGLVTHEQKKETNIIGTYSINPSFKAKIDYDLEDYAKIKRSLDFISACAQSSDIGQCTASANSNEFAWQLGCDKGAEKVLYDFAEFFQDCIDSEDNNCLCRKSLGMTIDKAEEYGLLNKGHALVINEDTTYFKKLEITVLDKTELSQNIDTKGFRGWIPIRYILNYDKLGLPSLTMVFVNVLKDNIPFELKYEAFGRPLKELILYRNTKNNVNLIDFVRQENDNLKYPNDQFALESNNQPIDINKMPNCKIKPKNIHRFCVTKNDYKVIAYDKSDNQVKERPLAIKFAAHIPPKKP